MAGNDAGNSKKVVFVTQETGADEGALRLACREARRRRAGVHIVYVIEVPYRKPVDAEMQEETEQADRTLARLEAIARQEDVPFTSTVLQARNRASAVLREVEQRGAGLIVVGVPRSALNGRTGAFHTALFLLRSAPCAVLVWREGQPTRPTREAIAVESSATGQP